MSCGRGAGAATPVTACGRGSGGDVRARRRQRCAGAERGRTEGRRVREAAAEARRDQRQGPETAARGATSRRRLRKAAAEARRGDAGHASPLPALSVSQHPLILRCLICDEKTDSNEDLVLTPKFIPSDLPDLTRRQRQGARSDSSATANWAGASSQRAKVQQWLARCSIECSRGVLEE